MTNAEFDDMIREAFRQNISHYFSEDDIDYTPHKFSPEFERKMNILMGKDSKPVKFAFKKLLIAVIAALLAVFLIAMSVSAVREAFINFLMDIFNTHTVVESIDDADAPLEFTDKYEITADMSDYELVDFRESIFCRKYTYENENCTIYFEQKIKEYYRISVNTEGYDIESIYIDNCEGFYVNMYNQNGQIIMWDNGDYVLSILVFYNSDFDFGRDKLIDMANSVQKVEK